MKNLKIKFGLLSLLAVLAVSVFLTSCEQEAILQQTPEIDAQEVAKQRSEIAKHLSIMIAEQSDFNQDLKAMCLAEKAKGYYETEFFFNIEKDKPSELFEDSSLDAKLSSSRGIDFRRAADYLMVNDPGLAILMIGDENATEFNTRIYVDNGFDDSDPTSQIEYYENGVLGSHSVSEVPEVLTFIVRESEAYLSPEELLLENPEDVTTIGTVSGNEINTFGYNTEALSSPPEETPSVEDTGLDSRWCQRDGVGGKERLWAFYATSDHEGGWNGNSGEFLIDIVFADNGSGITSLRRRVTGINNNRWYYPNQEIITWTAGNDLDRMKYHIMEDDGGGTYTLGLSLSGEMSGVTVSGSAQVAFTEGDDFVGEGIVEYCDPICNYGNNWNTYKRVGTAYLALWQW